MSPEKPSAATTHAHAPVATLHELEHRVEEAVEAALHVAELSLARRFGAGCVRGIRLALRTLWVTLIVAYFTFGALWLVTRYWLMPHVNEYRPWLEREVSRLLDARVQIARIESGWHGFNPRLRFANVQIFDRGGHAALTLPQLEATLSWTSVPALQARFRDLWILTPELDVQRRANGQFLVAGFVIDPKAAGGDGRLAEWVLSQSHIGVRNARVRYSDATVNNETVEFEDVDFEFRRGLVNNRFAFRARPPAALADVIDLRGEYRRPWFERENDLSQWTGRVFAQMDYADVARVAQIAHALPASMSIERAQGALRAWLAFDRGRVEQLIADLALVDVSARLGARLAPLQVDRLQGRIEQREWGSIWEGGQEFAAKKLMLSGADLALPPTDVRIRVTRAADDKPERGRVEASGLSLGTVSALAAHLPLPQDWHEQARRFGVRGNLANLRYTWEGDAAAPSLYSVWTEFEGLSMQGEAADPALSPGGRPRPGRPGFENLSGTLELDQRGGNAQVRARNALLEFPGILEARLAFDTLNAGARWTVRDGFEVRVESLRAASADIEINGQATYRSGGKGIGVIDASGQLVHADASQLHRIIPLVVAPATRAWVRTALVSGTARDGSFKLKGDLADFPFAQPASGDFRVTAKIVDATLDYLPPHVDETGTPASPNIWPRITNIEGDFVYERKKIEVTARRAQIFGVQLAAVRATLADLSVPDLSLSIDGKGSGPLADLIRFVNTSPVGGWLGGLLARASSSGNGTLELKLDIPLRHARDTKVLGSVVLVNNDVTLRDELPPFSRLNGKIEFTEKTLRIAGMTGNFIGGPFRADVNSRADGAIEIAGTGSTTPQAARRLADVALVQRLVDRTQGSARYSANVVLKNRRAEIRVASDLVGVSVDVPEPLRKTVAEATPLRVEIAPRDAGPRAGEADSIRVTLGSRLALAIERARDANGNARIERGAVAIGEGSVNALALPDSGMRATVNVERLDTDAWLPLFDGQATDGSSVLNAVSASLRELVIGGKSIANVVLGATRDADGIWLSNINSDQVSGAITWRPASANAQGRVSARLTRLTIPEQSRSQLNELLDAPLTELPALDVVANDFELVGLKLGRLEMLAQNVGTGPAAVWQLQRLEFSNPDGHMTASGQWQRATEGRQRRMTMNLMLDFADAGSLLARFGMPGVLRGGDGKLEGEIGWRGSPLSIDYPSLSGKLKLTTAKGQFLKADAGAGRLLGVLSLQSLPRRITLDFRDVFSEGFAFDSISASADFNAGVLSTQDFKMRGASATVLIEGSADLRRETQNLHVLVLPEINAGSASLMYALLANPAIGLGTFVAQLILRDPLSKAFSYEYDVTGDWSDPQVKRRERTSTVVGTAQN